MASLSTELNISSIGAPNAFVLQFYADRGYNAIAEGFWFTSLDDLKTRIKLKFPDAAIRDFGALNRKVIIEHREFVVYIANFLSASCDILAYNFEKLQEFIEVLDGVLVKSVEDTIKIIYYFAVAGESHNRWITLPVSRLPTITPELYPGIDIEQLVLEFSKADENILILYGPPGVGKTSFLKFLLGTRRYKECAYVKDASLMNLGEFWSELSAVDHDLLIFDDLDGIIESKSEASSDFVSNLLSYSDGIFANRTKIVITTNQPISTIDSALIRPGRCFDFLILEPLTFEEGRELWATKLGLPTVEYDILYSGKQQVTQAALMSDCKRLHNDIKERSYIKRGKRQYSVETKMNTCGIEVDAPQQRRGFGTLNRFQTAQQ